jgi:anti-sigma regulatory factor (Ser/Thr protein kinase)
MRPTAAEALALRTSEIIYPGAAEHVRRVRDGLRPLLADCPMADEVILCASELAANAVLHSNSRLPGGTFTVRGEISSGRYARIEVEDNGGPWIPAGSRSPGHHGLGIVDALATDWGIVGKDTNRTAWTVFDWMGGA